MPPSTLLLAHGGGRETIQEHEYPNPAQPPTPELECVNGTTSWRVIGARGAVHRSLYSHRRQHKSAPPFEEDREEEQEGGWGGP